MIIINKRFLSFIAIMTIAIFAGVLCMSAISKADSETALTGEITVVIDAGHGGIDGGVTGVTTGVSESELNLSVTKKLKTCFENAGIKVVMTRVDENGLYGVYNELTFKRRDMENRRKIIEKAKPNLVISVHMNKFSMSSRRGAQVFFDDKNEGGEILANSVQKSLNEMPECVKKTNALKGDYYILNSHKYAGCIVECGFLSNKEDERLLISTEYQEKLAYAIFKGSIDYLTETTFYGSNV